MFKLEVVVEDKNVVGVMKALNGKVVGEPKWREVIGAVVEQVSPGTTVLKADGLGQSMAERVASYLLKQTNGPEISRQTLLEAIHEAGGAKGSIFYIATMLRKQKLLGAATMRHKNAFYPIRRPNGNGHHAVGA